MQALKKIERTPPDSLWVSKLTNVDKETASKFIFEGSSESSLENHLLKILPTGGRVNYIQIAAPIELYAITRILKPTHVIEIGVSAGVSSAYFLQALSRNGKGTLHSIDLPEKQTNPRAKASWAVPAGKSTGWAVPKELRANWDLRLGMSGDVLPLLVKELPSVKIFLYDVPYTIESAISDYKVVDPKLRSRSVVMADNALEPIRWWARQHRRPVYQRKGLGLRGFSLS